MCGIAGCIDRQDPVSEDFIRAMCSQIIHRGPDDEGRWVHEGVGLGMRRLSIVDLHGGGQPIFNEDRSVLTVFNGEIYNHLQVRSALETKGHQFSTHTDTEVIVHQFEESGDDCLKHFNGMFSMAVYDRKKRRLFIARDRMGIKPLYYSFDNRRFLFASEMKSLVIKGGVERQLNLKAIWDYLTFRYIPEPDTIWKGVYKLPPGHLLVLDVDDWTMKIERYWDIPYPEMTVQTKKNDAALLEEFEILFEDAVKKRLNADVPVGILLSGGLDSSAVLAAVSGKHRRPIHSFSVAFEEGGEFSELAYARSVAKHLGAINHEVVIGHKAFIDFLPDFVWHMDEPMADLASVPLQYVSQLAKKHVTVVLSGEGSDEVLAGYALHETFGRIQLAGLYQKFPLILRKAAAKGVRSVSPELSDLLTVLNHPMGELPRLLARRLPHYFKHNEKKTLFMGSAGFSDSMALLDRYFSRVQGVHPFNQILYAMNQDWLVEDLLMKADKMTMANSIELRVPFLDYRIVEWAARSPLSIKVGFLGGRLVNKRILRMYSKNRLPETIVKRKKKGFPVPAYNWLSGPLREYVLDHLNSKALVNDMLSPKEVGQVVSKAMASKGGQIAKHKLWIILVLELWLRRWVQNV